MQRFCLLLIPLASLPTLATAHADNLPPAARDSNLPLNKLLQLRDSLPRKRLKVARIVPPDRPMESAGNQVLKAISDQYLQLIGEQLDLHFENVELPSPQAAVDALLEQRIDLLPRASDFEAANPELRLSLPYLRNQPIIVGRSSDRSLPLDLRGKQVLVLKNYLDSNRVRKTYPLSILREVSTTRWPSSSWPGAKRTPSSATSSAPACTSRHVRTWLCTTSFPHNCPTPASPSPCAVMNSPC
ncbi:hypothetical protein BME99_19755 [Pseudomonas protegens]|nr:hypothetical protein BME99_19755 [Pseudomonas protegens]